MILQGMMVAAMLLQSTQAVEPVAVEPMEQVATQNDPAELLNLGVKLANAGETEAARMAFEKVRSMRVDYTLETVEGRWEDPADLAREGLKMLDNGEFTRPNRELANR